MKREALGFGIMSDPSVFDLIQQGDRLFEQASYQAALGCYSQAVALSYRLGQDNTELEALDRLAVCWNNLGEPTKMVDAAARLLTRAKQLANRQYQMIAGLRLTDALAGIDLPTRWPELRPVLLDGLQTARQLGNDFYTIYHLVRLGTYSQQVGEIAPANEWLQEALRTLTFATEHAAGFRAEIYRSLAALAKVRRDWAEAVRYAEMALGAAREHGRPDVVVEAQYALASIRRWQGEQQEALALVEAALATSRRLNLEEYIVACLVLQVKLLNDQGLTEAAQQAYAALGATTYQNPDRYRQIGALAYQPMQDLARAEQSLLQFLASRPNHPDGHSQLALVLFEQGRVVEAVRAWRTALSHREQHPEALLGLALGLASVGDRQEALKIVGYTLSLRPQAADPVYIAEEWGWSSKATDMAQQLIVAYSKPS